jgi:probable F420-dependent oxidoreductase
VTPFRFGALTPASSLEQLHDVAHQSEDRGYSTLVLTDHLDLSGAHVTRLSWLPAFASAAAVTSTLRFTTMVANQDLRHPAVLAREVATLDVLSDGRFELGLGAGWNPVEYSWAGIDLDPPAARVRRLGEYVDIVSGLLRDDPAPFDFEGEFFTISRMPRIPASVQQPLPIVLGGSQRVVLSMAARLADTVNILTLKESGSTDEIMAEKVAWIREAADAAGRGPEIATSIVLAATGAEDPVAAVEEALPRSRFAQHVAQSQPLAAIAAAPHVLAGSTGAIVEELLRRRERWGLSYYVLPAESVSSMQPVIDRLAGT